MMRPQRHHSWSAAGSQEELKVGRHTVRIKRSLGEGGFAFIHLVEDVNTGRVLVLKRSSLQSHEGRVVYEKETSVMRSLAHPNIVQIVTAVELQSSKTGAILMEFCPRGHLLEALKCLGGKRMPESAVLSVMCDVVSAVKYMHDKGITHRDIKLENILRSSSGPHKLCDFGSCVQGRVPLETAEQRANEEEVVEKTTTQMYRAPEMVDLYLERELTEKVDVWALGCVLYAVCYLKNPFQDAGNLGILNARIRIPDGSEFSSGLVDLIRRCLTASSPQRPSASEMEAGIHALGKGNPLPPPLHRKSPEAERGSSATRVTAEGNGGRSATAASAATPTSTPSGSSNSGGVGRGEGGGGWGGMDGSGRSGGEVGTTGKHSAQGVIPSNSTPVASQPQLNPNSVAARRLASRKGSGSAPQSAGANMGGGSRASLPRPSPSSERGSTAAAALVEGGGGVPEQMQFGRGGSAAGWPGASSTGAGQRPGPTVSGVLEGGSGGGGDDPDPDGWSNFAAFDQFPVSELSAPSRQDSFGASFEASAAPAAPAAVTTAVGGREGDGRRVAAVESPLLYLGRNSDEDALGGAAAALGDQLAGVSFPASYRVEQQQRQQVVGGIPPRTASNLGEPGGSLLNAAGAGAVNQQHATGCQEPDDRLPGGPVGDGFAATFSRLNSRRIAVASGSSSQLRQQQQQSPPLVPPHASVAGGAVVSPPPPNMAFSSPPPPLVERGMSLPSQQWPNATSQQQRQWQTSANGRKVYDDACWNGRGSAAWSSGVMGGGVGLAPPPPVAATPPLHELQGQDSNATGRSMSGSWPAGGVVSGGVAAARNGDGDQLSGSGVWMFHQQQQQQQPLRQELRPFRNASPPPPPQFPGTGGPW